MLIKPGCHFIVKVTVSFFYLCLIKITIWCRHGFGSHSCLVVWMLVLRQAAIMSTASVNCEIYLRSDNQVTLTFFATIPILLSQPGFEPTSEELHLQQETFIQDTLPTELLQLRPMNLVSTIIHSQHLMRVQSLLAPDLSFQE